MSHELTSLINVDPNEQQRPRKSRRQFLIESSLVTSGSFLALYGLGALLDRLIGETSIQFLEGEIHKISNTNSSLSDAANKNTMDTATIQILNSVVEGNSLSAEGVRVIADYTINQIYNSDGSNNDFDANSPIRDSIFGEIASQMAGNTVEDYGGSTPVNGKDSRFLILEYADINSNYLFVATPSLSSSDHKPRTIVVSQKTLINAINKSRQGQNFPTGIQIWKNVDFESVSQYFPGN